MCIFITGFDQLEKVVLLSRYVTSQLDVRAGSSWIFISTMTTPPEQFQAFNSTAKMLACFQHPRKFQTGQKPNIQLLRTSDSMATILTKEHEITAVTTPDHSIEGQSLNFVATANVHTLGWDKALQPEGNFPQVIDPSPPSGLSNISQMENYIQAEK